MVDQLDLIVSDVVASAEFLRDAVGMQLEVSSETFAQLRTGSLTVMLSREALVPVEPARGIILHVRVEDVSDALARARRHGADILIERRVTDWGWELAMIQGPDAILIDFYRISSPQEQSQ